MKLSTRGNGDAFFSIRRGPSCLERSPTYKVTRTMMSKLRGILLLAALAVPVRAQAAGLGWQKQAEIVARDQDTVTLRGVRWGFRENSFGMAGFKDTTIKLDQVRDVYYY